MLIHVLKPPKEQRKDLGRFISFIERYEIVFVVVVVDFFCFLASSLLFFEISLSKTFLCLSFVVVFLFLFLLLCSFFFPFIFASSCSGRWREEERGALGGREMATLKMVE